MPTILLLYQSVIQYIAQGVTLAVITLTIISINILTESIYRQDYNTNDINILQRLHHIARSKQYPMTYK